MGSNKQKPKSKHSVLVKEYPVDNLDKSLMVIISSKTLRRATDRNLVRRRVREIMRPHMKGKKRDYKVFINNRGVLNLRFADLKEEIEKQLKS